MIALTYDLVFNSPLPNPKLWNGPTLGILQSQHTLLTGGWWHDARILAATGEGTEKEEQRAWEGWWNEIVVELARLSIQQKDALTVLLTGRSECRFSWLIKRIVMSKKLNFDIIALKPTVGPNKERFSNTFNFKQVFLEYLMETYRKADFIRVYEDRVKHTRAFRYFFSDYNKAQATKQTRSPIIAEVVQVADEISQLDPVVETAEVQRLINDHNLANIQLKREGRLQIKKTVLYTGYLISSFDTQKLLTLADISPSIPETELKFLANNILTPQSSSESFMEKFGGIGNKTTWKVTGTAVFENRIWAACVRSISETKMCYTETPVPIVVLALRKGARPIDAVRIQQWQPVSADKQYIFETTVGERALLQIQEEDTPGNENEPLSHSKTNKRKRAPDSDTYARDRSQSSTNQIMNGRGGNQQNHSSNRIGRGNSRLGAQRGYRTGGNSRSGRGRSRGGGQTYTYRSLDDVDKSNTSSGYNAAVTYEDFPSLQKQIQTPQHLVQKQYQHYQTPQKLVQKHYEHFQQ